jgi:hypothetical protein
MELLTKEIFWNDDLDIKVDEYIEVKSHNENLTIN